MNNVVDCRNTVLNCTAGLKFSWLFKNPQKISPLKFLGYIYCVKQLYSKDKD